MGNAVAKHLSKGADRGGEMSEWRPEEGWDNPWQDILALSPDKQTQYLLDNIYEAGADAIVAALKEQSTRVDIGVEKGTINLPFHGGSHGFVVFIPDEKEATAEAIRTKTYNG